MYRWCTQYKTKDLNSLISRLSLLNNQCVWYIVAMYFIVGNYRLKMCTLGPWEWPLGSLVFTKQPFITPIFVWIRPKKNESIFCGPLHGVDDFQGSALLSLSLSQVQVFLHFSGTFSTAFLANLRPGTPYPDLSSHLFTFTSIYQYHEDKSSNESFDPLFGHYENEGEEKKSGFYYPIFLGSEELRTSQNFVFYFNFV